MIQRECQIDVKFNIYTKSARRILRLFCVLFSVSFAVIILFTPSHLFGATLYLTPDSGSYHKGDTFLIDIRLDTEGEYINAVEVGLGFPNDILEFVDFSKGNSVLNLWVKEPQAGDGLFSFLGGTPGGYQGPDGLLGRIVFKVREPDTEQIRGTDAKPDAEQTQNAKIEFIKSSQVLLNDGLGTKANLKTKEAVFDILSEERKIPENEWEKELTKDTTPPEPFRIEINRDAKIFDNKYFIIFSAVDKQTGVDRYEAIEADKRGWLHRLTRKEEWKIAESPYLLKDQGLRSEIKVKAVDKAGNYRIMSLPPTNPPKKIWWVWVTIGIIGVLAAWWIARVARNRRETRRETDAK